MPGFLSSLLKQLQKLLCTPQGAAQYTDDEVKPQAPPPQTHPQQQQEYPPISQQQQQRPQQGAWQQAPTHHQPHQKPEQSQAQARGQTPSHSVSPPPAHKPYHGGQQDPNMVNQSDPHYMDLRARANKEGDAMARAFEASHEAYSGGDGARAKELSNEGKTHQAKMEELNKQASDWIFVKNNEDSKPGEIDLHGLYVKEAIAHTEKAIQQARQRGDSTVNLIVGKGLHSQGKVAKLKPAIEDLMRKENLVAELDPQNAGVLVVRLDGRGGGMDADEMTRKLERDEQCVIM